MRRLTAIALNVLIVGVAFLSTQAALAAESDVRPEFTVVGKNGGNNPEDFRFRLGEDLQVKATGDLAKEVEAEWGKTRSLTLYFDGERIADLKSPPLAIESGNQLLLDFPLVRDPEDDSNRQAWDKFFSKKHDYVMTVNPSLAIGNDLPLVVQSAKPVQFYIASPRRIEVTIIGGLAILVISIFLLVTKTKMLCDENTNHYSLSKCQMAFWGLLVALSFLGVWILTGEMERIPPQVLILLGISGGTGLSAIMIGKGKKPKAGYKSVEHASKGSWENLLDDGNGLSFHRLQVVIWTLILGAVFVKTVMHYMSMPEFSDTLLTLMGISNATYLGFKIPEKS